VRGAATPGARSTNAARARTLSLAVESDDALYVDALFSASPVGTPGGFPSLQRIRVADATRRNLSRSARFLSSQNMSFAFVYNKVYTS
jgi:hypothetical protein